MSDHNNNYNNTDWAAQSSRSAASDIDQGLRSFMLSVYNYMGLGLVVTAITAWLTYSASTVNVSGEILLTSIGNTLYNSPLRWLIIFAPLGMVFYLSARMNKMSVQGASTAFMIFSVLMGLSLSSIFLVYTQTSITRVFFITAIMFGGLSIYGYTTKANLTGMGSFLIMGVIGLVVASVINLFLQSTAMQLIISYVGVALFAGLTAYDTQRIKNMYFEVGGSVTVARKVAIMGALSLYLNFINMFTLLLQILGNRE